MMLISFLFFPIQHTKIAVFSKFRTVCSSGYQNTILYVSSMDRNSLGGFTPVYIPMYPRMGVSTRKTLFVVSDSPWAAEHLDTMRRCQLHR